MANFLYILDTCIILMASVFVDRHFSITCLPEKAYMEDMLKSLPGSVGSNGNSIA